ncbi:MAG: glycosyltransferase [Gemmatimonadaceae bacterium]
MSTPVPPGTSAGPVSPPASVVIASIVGHPFLDECLRSIEREVAELGAEVIVISCGAATYMDRLRAGFPWITLLHRPVRETVPMLRRRGVEQARGGVVAVIEEHCVAGEGWLRAALDAHATGEYAAVGGPVADNGYPRLVDWVVYFIEYNGSMPPAPSGCVTNLNGANIAYRREVLLAHLDRLDRGYWEVTLHPTLIERGVTLLSVPGMVVHHRGPFGFAYYLRQRYWFSRAYAGARTSSLPASRRLAYLIAAPALPLMLLVRIGARVVRDRRHIRRFAMTLPLFAPALSALVFGEWVGYLRGPGDALTKVE